MNRPFYTRIALLGIAMYLFIAGVLLIVALALQPSEWEYPLIIAGIAAAVGAVIYAWQPWGLCVGLLAGIVGLTFSFDGLAENLASPDSVLDFAYRPIFGLAGTVLVLGGSVAGLVQHFRGRTAMRGPAFVTRAVVAVVGLVAVLALGSTVLTVTGVDSVSAADRQDAITITADRWKFDTDSLTAGATSTTRIILKNEDPIVHTFTIDALGIDVKVGPLSEKLIRLDGPPAGTYEYYCRITGHSAMRGTLTAN
jgi:plastocyanin